MTSRHALEIVSLGVGGFITYKTFLEAKNLLLKDIEVLEILKKHYLGDGWSDGGVIEFWEMNEKELKKVKEWLENDNK